MNTDVIDAIESVRSLVFAPGERMLVIRTSETGDDCAETIVSTGEEAAAFLGERPGQFCLQTFGDDGEPLAYVGLAAVLQDDHRIAPTITLARKRDGLRVGIWRLDAPLSLTSTKMVEVLEEVARGLGNERAADPAPLPGVDGWAIAHTHADRIYSVDQLRMAYAPSRWADAIVYGEVSPEILDREIIIGSSQNGAQTYRGRWKNWKTTVRDLLNRLSEHKEGLKDGPCLLQGPVIDGIRQANAIPYLDLLILDLDTGESIEAIRQRLMDLGLFGVIYTTHSHLKPVTDIKKDEVIKWLGGEVEEPDIEQACNYLRERKRYQPAILEGAELLPTEHTSSGVMLKVKHKPMPKFRVVLVLENRYIIAERATLQRDAISDWKAAYAGASKLLGAYFDRSCTDPSRLFYTPRHPKGAKEFRIEVVAGKPLDLDKVERISAEDLRREAESPFEAAARAMGAGDEYATTGLKAFAAKFAHRFEAADCMQDRAPDWMRGPASGGGYTARCPGDGDHSNAGCEDDAGFFVVNASESRTESFVRSCQHDACSGHDRLALLDLFCEQVGITDAEELREWVPETVEDDEEEEDRQTPAKPEGKSAQRAKRKSDPDNEALFQQFSDEWAYVAEGPSGRFVKTLPDGSLEFKGVDALEKLYAHKPIVIFDDKGNKKCKPLVREWTKWPMSEERKYSGIRFAPGKPDSEIRPYLNTWRGLGVVPKIGSWTKMRTHIEEVLCAGSEVDARFVIGWMAHVLQNLGNIRKKVTVSPVIRGEQGAGKSLVFDYYRRIFGRHGVVLSKPEQIVGRFNSPLGEALFVQLEEAFFAGDPRIDGPLKDLLTGKDMQIERKNIDPFTAPNYAHFAIISNAERPVPITEGARRYYAIECSDQKANQTEWFDPIVEEMENGGVQAMAWDLLHWSPPKGDWRFLRQFPKTVAGDRMIAAGLSALERFILTWTWGAVETDRLHCLLDEEHNKSIPTADIADAFKGWAEDNVSRRERDALKTDNAAVGIQLKKMLPKIDKDHERTGNSRLFPPRGRVIEMLQMHSNGGYREFLDMLARAEA